MSGRNDLHEGRKEKCLLAMKSGEAGNDRCYMRIPGCYYKQKLGLRPTAKNGGSRSWHATQTQARESLPISSRDFVIKHPVEFQSSLTRSTSS